MSVTPSKVRGRFAGRIGRLLVLLMVAGLLGSSAAAAQMELGVMQGVVKDEAGAPLADVTFRIHDVERGRDVVVKSDKNGRFYRRGLPAVEYEISSKRTATSRSTTPSSSPPAWIDASTSSW